MKMKTTNTTDAGLAAPHPARLTDKQVGAGLEQLGSAMIDAVNRKLSQHLDCQLGGWMKDGGWLTVEQIAARHKVDPKEFRMVLKKFARIPHGELYRAWLLSLRFKGLTVREIKWVDRSLRLRPTRMVREIPKAWGSGGDDK